MIKRILRYNRRQRWLDADAVLQIFVPKIGIAMGPQTPATWDVFISYARENLDAARALATFLRDSGFGVFLADDDLTQQIGSTQWSEFIDCTLDQSLSLVVIVTPESMTSPWVAYEWRSMHNAILRGQPALIIPVCWHDVEREALPRALLHYQVLDARQANTRGVALNDLATLLRGHTRGGGAARRAVPTATRKGDEVRSVPELLHAVAPDVARVVRAILGEHMDLDDVVQECLINLAHALPSFRGESRLGRFANRIAVAGPC